MGTIAKYHVIFSQIPKEIQNTFKVDKTILSTKVNNQAWKIACNHKMLEMLYLTATLPIEAPEILLRTKLRHGVSGRQSRANEAIPCGRTANTLSRVSNHLHATLHRLSVAGDPQQRRHCIIQLRGVGGGGSIVTIKEGPGRFQHCIINCS